MQIEATLIDKMGSDLTVVNAARVSFNKKSQWENILEVEAYSEKPLLQKNDIKLISYLAKHKHTSPFGHCFASFHVKAPIFVARQLVKHKFLRWNEVSRRYVDDEPEFYVPDEWRLKADNVKQGSSDETIKLLDIDMYGFKINDTYQDDTIPTVPMETYLYSILDDLDMLYNKLLSANIAPEMARMVLPQNAMTEWYWSGSLDAFADMCRLRLDSHAQYESRIVAEQISKEMEQLFPVSWKALLNDSN